MNGINRVLNAIHRVPGTPVPRGELTVELEFMEDLFRWRGISSKTDTASDEEKLIECCRILNLDLVCIQSVTPEKDGPENLESLSRISGMKNSGLFVFWVVNGAFQTALNRRGFNEFMVNIARSPERVVKDMQQISRQVVSTIKQGIAAGAHGIIIADDIAYTNATYVSPGFCKKYIFPLWQEQVSVALSRHIPVFFHSDGRINDILPIIVDARFDGVQCIEPAAGMDIEEVKRKYGNRLCLMGNIDPSLLAGQHGIVEPDEGNPGLARAVESVMAAAAPDGGLIFGTCSGLYAGLSPEKVHFMFQMAKTISEAAVSEHNSR